MKRLVLYEETINDDGSVEERDPILIVQGANLDDMLFQLAPTIDPVVDARDEQGFPHTP